MGKRQKHTARKQRKQYGGESAEPMPENSVLTKVGKWFTRTVNKITGKNTSTNSKLSTLRLKPNPLSVPPKVSAPAPAPVPAPAPAPVPAPAPALGSAQGFTPGMSMPPVSAQGMSMPPVSAQGMSIPPGSAQGMLMPLPGSAPGMSMPLPGSAPGMSMPPGSAQGYTPAPGSQDSAPFQLPRGGARRRGKSRKTRKQRKQTRRK